MRQHREETVPKARRDWNTEGKVLGKNQVPPSQETAGFHKVGVGGLQAGREVLGPDEWGSWEIGKVVSSEEEVKSFAVEWSGGKGSVLSFISIWPTLWHSYSVLSEIGLYIILCLKCTDHCLPGRVWCDCLSVEQAAPHRLCLAPWGVPLWALERWSPSWVLSPSRLAALCACRAVPAAAARIACAAAKAVPVTGLENERRKKAHWELLSLCYLVCPLSCYLLDLLEFVFLKLSNAYTVIFLSALFLVLWCKWERSAQCPVSLHLSPSLSGVSLGGLCWIRDLCSFFTALLHCII